MTGHSDAKALPCSYCPKSFKTKIQLDIHESRHTGQGKYECSICGKRFPQKGEVKNHEQQHGEERGYTCDHCGKSFARDAYLRIHMKVHAKRGEVPPKPARRYRQSYASERWNYLTFCYFQEASRSWKVVYTGLDVNCDISGQCFGGMSP